MLCLIAAVLSLASLIGAGTVPCICTMDYTPVCGVDGKTYGNKCGLDCAGVQLDHQGECLKPATQAVSHPCACPRIYMPVCGQNGVTYANQCEMNCAGEAFFQDGACISAPAGVIHKRAAIPCICTFIYRPVCGSDGITYGNECNLKCAADSSPTLTKVADRACGTTTTTTKTP